ncbi:MAG: shikimate kinase [Planctomycetota bacterium]
MTPTSPIALIGYRGTGKTTVARLLAAKLSLDWVDADVEVELKAGRSIAAIFEDAGESAFRDFESDVVDKLCARDRLVLALGGGAILRAENRERIATCSEVVWLRATAATIAERILGDPTTAGRRPNLTNRGGRHEIEQLLTDREPFYRSCATLEVDTESKDPADIADEIVAQLGRSS